MAAVFGLTIIVGMFAVFGWYMYYLVRTTRQYLRRDSNAEEW